MSDTDYFLDVAPVEAAIPDSDTRKDINTQLLQSLISAFAQNPEVDLAAFLPSDYKSHFPRGPPPEKPQTESKLAQLNRRTIDAFLKQFSQDPTRSIVQGIAFPLRYNDQRDEPKHEGKDTNHPKRPAELPPDYFASMLDRVGTDSFDVVAPLSPEVENMLREQSHENSQDPVSTLKTVIRNSCFLWSGTALGRFVSKLSDNVAVRVSGGDQANDYAAYEFLAEHAPDIPAPRPHGLIKLGGLSLMFFSYVPGVTLEKVWPNLSYQHKKSIQTQLDHVLARLRTIPQDDRPLGMVNGQGVVDLRALMRERRSDKSLKTSAEFEDFVFSYRPWVAETYVKFLQQLLPESRFDEPCVFTHGDLTPGNIMVDTNENGDWSVTGIIDWSDAGFYPAYWESVKVTTAFLANNESDWFLMLPASISPARYSTQWLVDRLWDSMIQNLAHLDKHVKKSRTTKAKPNCKARD